MFIISSFLFWTDYPSDIFPKIEISGELWDISIFLLPSNATSIWRHTAANSTIRQKAHKCNHCLQCVYAPSFKIQIMTHMGEKSYKCSQCDYTCTRVANLHTHMMTRGGIGLHSQLSSARVYGDYQLIITINSSILVNNGTRLAAECHPY